jgi:Zn-finger nucleic acid-binding protein
VDCPACKGVVVVVEYQRIELDYCTKCYGVWFDAGELSLLTERLSLQGAGLTVNEIAALPAKKVAEKPRHCPICRKNMKKVIIGSAPEVLVDVCARGDGLWFDGGEVGQVLGQLKDKHAAADKQGRVIDFLGEVFHVRG